MNEWQKIETAPKNVWVLVFGTNARSGCRYLTGRHFGGGDWESGDDGYGMYLNPTHWMHLPAAPQEDAP